LDLSVNGVTPLNAYCGGGQIFGHVFLRKMLSAAGLGKLYAMYDKYSMQKKLSLQTLLNA